MRKLSSDSNGRESAKQVKRRARYEALLDSVEVSSGIIATLSDGLFNVPGLKSIATLVNQIVIIAKVRLLFLR